MNLKTESASWKSGSGPLANSTSGSFAFLISPFLFLLGGAFVLALLLNACGGGGGSDTSNPPPNPPTNLQLELLPVASGLRQPLDLQDAMDGSGRLFVVEQRGSIRVIENGTLLSAPFLDLSAVPGFVVSGGEQGLLGLAFHPNFRANGRFFLNYTTRRLTGQLQTVIAEYQASPPSANTAVGAERIVMTYDQPFVNHNGGGLAFGPDGFLYIGAGDGGNEGDPAGNGQNLNTVLGKLLVIDVDAPPAPGLDYAIPANNPFAGQPGRRGEIWAYGLRNPFRFSFDRLNGRLFVGDVGQDRFEEVDIVTIGDNLGWNIMEGGHCFRPPNGCDPSGLTLPIFTYDHGQGDDTVTGGYVYRGTRVPQLTGTYVFGDFSSGRIWGLTQNPQGMWERTQLLDTAPGDLSAFGQDAAGEIYAVRYSSGAVARIRQVGGE